MFEHILSPLDGSSLAECVLPHLVAVAKAYHSEITLFQILDPVGLAPRSTAVDPLDWTIRKAEAEAYLKGIAARLKDAGANTNIEVREGRAAEGVVEYARSNPTDLVVLSSHGQSGISGWNVSSVVQKIIQRVHSSIMVIRAYQPVQQQLDQLHYQKILLPLDGSPRAEGALLAAKELANHHDAEILLAHIVQHPEIPSRTPLSQEDQQLINRLIERNRIEATKYLEEIGARLGGKTTSSLLVHDSPSVALHELVEQDKVDLVILSAHGYTGGTRWPYGSVVTGFIAYSSVPLFIMQDLPSDQIEPTRAELAAQERGGR